MTFKEWFKDYTGVTWEDGMFAFCEGVDLKAAWEAGWLAGLERATDYYDPVIPSEKDV